MSEQPLKILAITDQDGSFPKTGAQVRSWYSLRMLEALGDLHIISLAGKIGDHDNPLFNANIEFSTRTLPHLFSDPPIVSHRTATFRALTMPWRTNWVGWLRLLSHHGCHPSFSLRLRLFQKLVQLQHRFLTFATDCPPALCSGNLDTWRRIKSSLIKELNNERYDLLWAENTTCWPVVEDLLSSMSHRPALTALNTQNIEHQVLLQIQKSSATSQLQSFYRNEARAMRKLEKHAFEKPDIVFFCSNEDASYARKLEPKCEAYVFPNGVDPVRFPKQPESKQDNLPTILFPGSFDYQPNYTGALWLIDKVWPLVSKVLPKAKLVLAGRNAIRLKSLADKHSFIEIASDVADMSEYFARSWLVAVPLLSGGGTRLKILEALSSNRAVVATPLGAEGIPYISGYHLTIADDAEDFAKSILTLITDHNLRNELARNGNNFASASYGWNKLCSETAKILNLRLRKR